MNDRFAGLFLTSRQRGFAIGYHANVGQPSDPRETARVIDRNPAPVAIVATCNRFQVSGEAATPGETYTVPADTAAGLVAIGKAKLA